MKQYLWVLETKFCTINMSKKPNEKIYLGISALAFFLFMAFAFSAYTKVSASGENRLVCPVIGEISIQDLLSLVITISVAVGAGIYYLMHQRIEENEQKIEKKEDCLKKNTELVLKFLGGDERKIVDTILKDNGKVLQAEISRMEGMTRLRAHRALRKLEERNVIQIEKMGKTNIVRLNGEIKEGLKGK